MDAVELSRRVDALTEMQDERRAGAMAVYLRRQILALPDGEAKDELTVRIEHAVNPAGTGARHPRRYGDATERAAEEVYADAHERAELDAETEEVLLDRGSWVTAASRLYYGDEDE